VNSLLPVAVVVLEAPHFGGKLLATGNPTPLKIFGASRSTKLFVGANVVNALLILDEPH